MLNMLKRKHTHRHRYTQLHNEQTSHVCRVLGANRAHNACKFLLRFKAIETEGDRDRQGEQKRERARKRKS